MRRRLLLVAAAVVGVFVGVPAALAGSQSFTEPGSFSFVVPAGVWSVQVVAVGGSGGAGGATAGDVGGPGGFGAVVEGAVAVSPGQVLFGVVGGAGVDGGDEGAGAAGGAGGAGGGGHGGDGAGADATGGGGGGGSSDVRTAEFDLDSRVLVAAGGGGGGGAGVAFGGFAGGDAGADGHGFPLCIGGAGTDMGGGTGGAGTGGGGDGDFGGGGGGGQATSGAAGGGGGSGWYGGGGGGAFDPACGGGGGSNHASTWVTNFTQALASSLGDGWVTFTYTGTVVSVPGLCDPLLSACAGAPDQQEGTPPLAPGSGGGGEPAVGQARMPNLRASVTANWQAGTIRVSVRVLISKPRLVKRWFSVRVHIRALDKTRLVRVRAHGKQVRTLQLAFTAPASVVGKHVVVAVDPTKRVLETRERDNSAHARIR